MKIGPFRELSKQPNPKETSLLPAGPLIYFEVFFLIFLNQIFACNNRAYETRTLDTSTPIII
jgi:hypothetical protein